MSKIIHVYNIAARIASGLTQRTEEVEVFLKTQKIAILLFAKSTQKFKKYTILSLADRPETAPSTRIKRMPK
jgi:hypothetical protein